MANFEIIVQPFAELDFDEIWFSIAQSNIKVADSFVDRIKQKLDILGTFPESGPKRPDILPNCRILVEGQYVVLYVFENAVIKVLRVVHGARDLNELNLI